MDLDSQESKRATDTFRNQQQEDIMWCADCHYGSDYYNPECIEVRGREKGKTILTQQPVNPCPQCGSSLPLETKNPFLKEKKSSPRT